ncbi:putative repeat protein (TIGR01451 family)/predicted secreted protein (Por secretion system target) [Flavobacterium croceum DSM 17960]|uniref:Putative repeat protein (TIGR01451 family)/predicted secreted protein (Por secretion system target) n=1 Tax=Flavobacterium croceum DSM 17960 TaxID=1121886 RepID=A0A2S4N510_9FLAO|nr:T9SS type A sorting domain-containing protein [Flavobacterium croceum]POS00807.1 putative repeat protein (TIGR01451 family)/predicted secreted protein (Por secretion system target) [Flavobacterium croceum DSM 17960]
MKTKIFYFILTFTTFCNAQIINFPDPNFKIRLLQSSTSNSVAKDINNNNIKIDSNNNNEIEINEALQVYKLNISPSSNGIGNISSIIGIENFTNLTHLTTNYNVITSMNLNNLSNLKSLGCYNNQLSSLELQNCTLLQELYCQNNQLTSLNISNLNSLNYFQCSNNQLTSLNIDNCNSLINLFCDNNLLTTININNSNNLTCFVCNNNNLNTIFSNNNSPFNICLDFYNNPNLSFICTSTFLYQAKVNNYGYVNCTVNPYCSFFPSGNYNSLKGKTYYDLDNNGCSINDLTLNNIKLKSTLGTIINYTTTINDEYKFYFSNTGSFIINPEIENSLYFNINPNNPTINYNTINFTEQVQDFCITANGQHNDLEIILIPINAARPGFDANYKIVYKNKGTTTLSGTINFTFDDSVLDFVSSNPNFSNQSIGSLNWNFTNLLPFESREINIILNLNSPIETPALNSGDLLNYTAFVNGQLDETPNDNIAILNQIVVNSYDPNDKTCLEGTTITTSMVGEYVHYLIRFENNGTANAQNIVVKDMIDINKFDINTLIPIKGSHNFETRISSTNKVEFIFQNINLPFDDANNDGYVSFKIKTKPNLVVGNTFSNSANIYFDYNFPIVTNNYTTTVQNTLGLQENDFINNISVYPNPVKNILNFKIEDNISKVEVYDISGRILSSNSIHENKIDLSNLKTGNYILKLYTEKGIMNTKIIKE